ncbi:hypothetical protein IAS59_005222 [Cryptococcus gattii]
MDSATSNSTNTLLESVADGQTAIYTAGCSYDRNISNYLSCAKSRISTTTLIGVGTGITVGVLAIAFGCIWLTRKSRRKAPSAVDRDDDEEESSKQTVKQDMEKGRRSARKLDGTSNDGDIIPVQLREDNPSVLQASQRINKATPRTTEIDRTDSFASEMDTLSKTEQPANSSRVTVYSPDHSQPAISYLSTSIRSQRLASNTVGSRNLFPSNSSPSPRHIQLRNEPSPTRASAISTTGFQLLPSGIKRTTRSIPLRGVVSSASRPVSTVPFVQRTTSIAKTNVPLVPIPAQIAPSSPTSIHYRSFLTRTESDASHPLQMTVPLTVSSNSVPSNPNATAPLNIRKSVVQNVRVPSYHDMNFRPTLQTFNTPSKMKDGPPRSIDLSDCRVFNKSGTGPNATKTRTKKGHPGVRVDNGSNESERTSEASNSANLKIDPTYIALYEKNNA